MQIQTDEMRKAMGEADGVMTHRGRCVSLAARCVAAPRRMALFVSRRPAGRPPRTRAVEASLESSIGKSRWASFDTAVIYMLQYAP